MSAARVDPDAQRVFKFWPSDPPTRGEIIMVDGEPSRVTRCRVRWDGPHWEIRSLRVKPVFSRRGGRA